MKINIYLPYFSECFTDLFSYLYVITLKTIFQQSKILCIFFCSILSNFQTYEDICTFSAFLNVTNNVTSIKTKFSNLSIFYYLFISFSCSNLYCSLKIATLSYLLRKSRKFFIFQSITITKFSQGQTAFVAYPDSQLVNDNLCCGVIS